jgi:hypothetical protein
MKRQYLLPLLVSVLLPVCNVKGQQNLPLNKLLEQSYNLVPQHSKDTQYYEMESRLMKYALDGTRLGVDIYRLQLRCVPNSNTAAGDEYSCLRASVQLNNAPEITIPSLTNWKYYFSLSKTNTDNKEPTFGIDPGKFEKIKDENGKVLAVENSYHVYNAFIDFHSMSVFSERTDSGKGIQDLKHIGDKIIHSASFSKPLVNIGSQVGEGSYFKNGEITLLFKGLGLVNHKNCAVLEYDSGESSFFMVIKPMPNMEIPTKGSSHYFGDIFKDIKSAWIQKATLHELVISETSIPGQASKINSVIERSITISNITSGKK